MTQKELLFNLDLFNPSDSNAPSENSVFPQMVFKQQFDCHLFMRFNDWFNNEVEYKMLQVFLESINEPYLYCSVPELHNCPDIKIDVKKSHKDFVRKYTMENKPNHPNHRIGLRRSATGFWYGKSPDWAMVSDLHNNIIIVGLCHAAALNFRADFGGKYFGIEKVIDNIEQIHSFLNRNNPDATYPLINNNKEMMERYN
jgi:hypothetical protein